MATDTATGHLLFVPSPTGYRIEQREGEVPEQGAEVVLADARFVVSRVGPSPYPGDERPCGYLLRQR